MPTADLADWFRTRTFPGGALDLAALAARREQLGISVSVVLPARDEAATIGPVVDAVQALAGGLVDELVVMDGGSTDATAEIAAARGARVHRDDAVLPDVGPALGKGDALWRSLAVTSGDLVAFMDTDVREPTSAFVAGVLAPLLWDDRVALVKAFYERPVQVGRSVEPTGGGRVTELMARPLLNAFWPALAGIVQPLSGEYAARRSLLESVPFFTGYGVELGLLVDTFAAEGADAIAQVDLARRHHRNQSTAALSRMAYGILQVAAARRDLGVLPSRYVQFTRDADGTVTPVISDVAVVERPPLRSLQRETVR